MKAKAGKRSQLWSIGLVPKGRETFPNHVYLAANNNKQLFETLEAHGISLKEVVSLSVTSDKFLLPKGA